MSLSKDDILLINRVSLISLTTAEAAIYGFTFALYILCVRSLSLQLKDWERRRQNLFTLLYMSLLAVDAQDALTSYVNRVDYPGSGYRYFVGVFQDFPVAAMGDAASLLLNLMSFSIQIWRLWIVWKGSQYSLFIVLLPVLSLLTSLGLETAGFIMIVRAVEISPGLGKPIIYGEITSQLCISIIVTVSVIARILLVRKRNVRIMSQTHVASPYTSVIAMLIESFALEFVWMVAIPVCEASTTNPVTMAASNFFVDTRPFIEVLAYLLVVHRVSTGQGWRKDTAEQLSTLRWNRDELQTTQISAWASVTIAQAEA